MNFAFAGITWKCLAAVWVCSVLHSLARIYKLDLKSWPWAGRSTIQMIFLRGLLPKRYLNYKSSIFLWIIKLCFLLLWRIMALDVGIRLFKNGPVRKVFIRIPLSYRLLSCLALSCTLPGWLRLTHSWQWGRVDHCIHRELGTAKSNTSVTYVIP